MAASGARRAVSLEAISLPLPRALAQAIEARIVEHGIPPGTRLGTKTALREEFGVASTTVNEALRLLETRGLVHTKPGPGGGIFVAEPSGWLALSELVLGLKHSGTAVRDGFAVRQALEPLIAAEAAVHHTKADLRDLRRLLRKLEDSVHDPSRYLRANWELHRRISSVCTNEFARSLYDGLLGFAESEVEQVAGRGAFDGASNFEVHRRYIEAIASGDPSLAEDAARRHNAAALTLSA
jgi:DNA-binding FadR family transcriptional regulator